MAENTELDTVLIVLFSTLTAAGLILDRLINKQK
jgi:hypothetical protein